MDNACPFQTYEWLEDNVACNVYDNKYCKVLIIACCDMQYEDGAT